MVGAGVFVGPAPAARAAGAWFLLGIPAAAGVVLLCVLGVIVHGAAEGGTCPGVRSRLGVVPGRISASLSLVGHVGAMAAVAGGIAQYLLPSAAKGVGAVAILLAVLAATAGVRISGRSGWLWIGLGAATLGVAVAACFAIAPAPLVAPVPHGLLGVSGAAGTMFFGFLGFERLVVPGRRTTAVWRDVIVAVVVVTVTMVIIGAALLYQLGSARLGLSPTPVTDALAAASAAGLAPPIGFAVALAMVPALLAAQDSVRSTAVAVVAVGDLPRVLGRTGRGGTPYVLDLSAGIAAALLVQVLTPAQAINLAACCILLHHAFVNIAAQQALHGGRWRSRALCLGMVLAVALAMSMPVPVMLSALVVAVAGPLLTAAVTRRWR
jgi:basic amino acid/polyamine antiporter, APA family